MICNVLTMRPISPPIALAATVLQRSEALLEPLNDILSPGEVFLGIDAPLEAMPSLFKNAVRLAGPKMADKEQFQFHDRIKHSTEGMLKGLFAEKGFLHAQAKRVAPGIVTAPAPRVGANFATAFSRVAKVVDVVLGVVFVGNGTITAIEGVYEAGNIGGLVTNRKARGGALQAIGGALLLIEHPATLLASGLVLGMSAANDLGLFNGLNKPSKHQGGSGKEPPPPPPGSLPKGKDPAPPPPPLAGKRAAGASRFPAAALRAGFAPHHASSPAGTLRRGRRERH